jgi:hypothetical protein
MHAGEWPVHQRVAAQSSHGQQELQARMTIAMMLAIATMATRRLDLAARDQRQHLDDIRAMRG